MERMGKHSSAEFDRIQQETHRMFNNPNESRAAYFIGNDYVVIASYPNREAQDPTHTSVPVQLPEYDDESLTVLAWNVPMHQAHAQIISDLAWKIERSEWCGTRSDYNAGQRA
jgi:hypothetical protein